VRPGFVIMQIGNQELDRLYFDVIAPALRACDIDPKRVDRHNEGRLLNSEVSRLIREADIIVADLTNERPNCYLEVGLAMGIGKFEHLVLTARSDHLPERPGRLATDPRVHFDLSGYDFLYWDPSDHETFRTELERRVRYRLSRLPPPPAMTAPWNQDWLQEHRTTAGLGVVRYNPVGFMEVVFGTREGVDVDRATLLEGATRAQVHTFGWPLWIVLDAPEARPRPVRNGIVAQVSSPGDSHYDYWALTQQGSGYLLSRFFEDRRDGPKALYFDTQIYRVTEAFLYIRNLLSALHVSAQSAITVQIRHVGIQARAMSAANPGRRESLLRHEASEDESMQAVTVRLQELEGDLLPIVKRILGPLFELFGFFRLSESVYRELVDAYCQGRVI